jgi:cysteine desulfurase
MNRPIYLDNQATTPPDPEVVKAMLPYFQEKFGNAASVHHSYGQEGKEAVEQGRRVMAESIQGSPREIIFTSGATEAINLALKGVAEKYIDRGQHIITQVTEHKAVLDTCNYLVRKGWKVTTLPVDSKGMVNPSHVTNAITRETVLVAIMHANNEIGTIQPVQEIGTICRQKNILFMVDACQSFGKLDLNVKSMNINLLAATAHKLYGPKGIGFLFVSQKDPKVELQMQMEGGGHERGFRSGTLAVPLIVGFARAVELSLEFINEENLRLGELRDQLYSGIRVIHPEVILNGSRDKRLAHNLSLCFPGLDGETMIMKMKGIACSTGSACSSTSLEPSHVIKALGRDTELAHSAIRFSLGRFNTSAEIDTAISVINRVVRDLKEKKLHRRRIHADGFE